MDRKIIAQLTKVLKAQRALGKTELYVNDFLANDVAMIKWFRASKKARLHLRVELQVLMANKSKGSSVETTNQPSIPTKSKSTKRRQQRVRADERKSSSSSKIDASKLEARVNAILPDVARKSEAKKEAAVRQLLASFHSGIHT